jgi:hypothetical protein
VRLEQPNVLLLDDPTNILVLVSTCRLESALSSYEGALVISHDERIRVGDQDRPPAATGERRAVHDGRARCLSPR